MGKEAVKEKALAEAEKVFGKKEIATTTAAPRGLEQGSPEHMVLPHVLLLQPTSKHVTQRDFKAGSCINSLTEAVYESPIVFVPITFQSFYNVYRYEGVGDKKKKIWEFRTSDKNDPRLKGRRWKADENGKREIEPVMRFLSLINQQPAVIDFSKSSQQGGKKLYTLASLSRADLFANSYKLVINKETNEHSTFYVKDVEVNGPAAAEDFSLAESFHNTFGKQTPVVADAADEEVPF